MWGAFGERGKHSKMDCGHSCITVKILKSMGLHASKGQITCSGNHISTKLSFKRGGSKVGPRESILRGNEMVKLMKGKGRLCRGLSNFNITCRPEQSVWPSS